MTVPHPAKRSYYGALSSHRRSSQSIAAARDMSGNPAMTAATATATKATTTVPSREFYREYHGHRVDHLRTVLSHLRSSATGANSATGNGTGPPTRLIWTAGDSSLDNKYWLTDVVPAVPGHYRDVLDPPVMKPDVTYWLNRLLSEETRSADHGDHFSDSHKSHGSAATAASLNGRGQPAAVAAAAINAAVEATTINERTFRLRPQDAFLRDHIQPNDILIVSVGGNDVALCPLPCTIASVGCLVCLLVPTCLIDHSCTACAVPLDDGCCGFGPSLLSCLGSCPPCVGYVKHLLGTRVESYIRQLTSRTKPSLVLVCTIYYPDENATPSWAGGALAALGYNSNPSKLQRLIRLVHERATSQIRLDGGNVPVIPVPLYRVLDGRTTEDYVARVEPSSSGGRKMAELLLHLIRQHDRDDAAASPYRPPPTPPSPTAMQDRG